MNLDVEVKAIQELIEANNHIQILLGESADRDSVASALALFLTLTQKGKNVTVAYPRAVTVAWNSLIGVNKISQHFSNKNFVISLDYTEGAIEKVSYNIEGNKFNLVIEPRPEAPPFNEKSVSYHYSGGQAGMIITIDTPDLERLGKFYTENKDVFSQKPIVNIDANTTNKQYGKINLVRPAAATAELVGELIKSANWHMSDDIATNLYDGLVSGSRSFAGPNIGAHTFEMAAWFLKSGARRAAAPPPFRQEEFPRRELATSGDPEGEITPPDWFKPKIFKGGSTGGGLV